MKHSSKGALEFKYGHRPFMFTQFCMVLSLSVTYRTFQEQSAMLRWNVASTVITKPN